MPKLIKTMISEPSKKMIEASNQKISEHDPVKVLCKTIERQKIYAPQNSFSQLRVQKNSPIFDSQILNLASKIVIFPTSNRRKCLFDKTKCLIDMTRQRSTNIQSTDVFHN